MTFRDTYRKQVALLVRILPLIAKESCFALVAGDGSEFGEWASCPRNSGGRAHRLTLSRTLSRSDVE
jgi:hypothetical protein